MYAIGNPFGFSATLTTGIVSALNRSIGGLNTGDIIEDVIQIDAAINPGNSGGPLLDSRGRLIGINSQIASPSGASVGVGFAVPVNTVQRVVPQLVANGVYTAARLGISGANPRTNRYVAQRLGVAGSSSFRSCRTPAPSVPAARHRTRRRTECRPAGRHHPQH